MHVHANQINPNAQLDALYSAQKSEAKREAARTRKKLSEPPKHGVEMRIDGDMVYSRRNRIRRAE